MPQSGLCNRSLCPYQDSQTQRADLCPVPKSISCRSPFIIEDPDPAENIVKVALEGTQNVIKSVLKTRDTVKRMVLTSSVAGELLWPHIWYQLINLCNYCLCIGVIHVESQIQSHICSPDTRIGIGQNLPWPWSADPFLVIMKSSFFSFTPGSNWGYKYYWKQFVQVNIASIIFSVQASALPLKSYDTDFLPIGCSCLWRSNNTVKL